MLWPSVCVFFLLVVVVAAAAVVIIAGVIWARTFGLLRTWFTHVLLKFTCANHYGKSPGFFVIMAKTYARVSQSTTKKNRQKYICCNFCSSIRNVDKFIDNEDRRRQANVHGKCTVLVKINGRGTDGHHTKKRQENMLCDCPIQFLRSIWCGHWLWRWNIEEFRSSLSHFFFVRLSRAWFLIHMFSTWPANTLRNVKQLQLVEC